MKKGSPQTAATWRGPPISQNVIRAHPSCKLARDLAPLPDPIGVSSGRQHQLRCSVVDEVFQTSRAHASFFCNCIIMSTVMHSLYLGISGHSLPIDGEVRRDQELSVP